MLIAQSFIEYGLLATLFEGMYRLRFFFADYLPASPLGWLGLLAGVVVVFKWIRR
jgi:hypothetical protein